MARDIDRKHRPRHRCGLRPLVLKPGRRAHGVPFGLLRALTAWLPQRDFDLALISGTVRQRRLYARLGFQSLADPVGLVQAPFQPMQQPPGRAQASMPGLFGGYRRDTP